MSRKVLTINSSGMIQERPVSFSTVAEAEAASFLSDEICSVLETRRFYQFDSGSSETRDGVRVLTPAGGGRLLATKTGSDDVEIPKIGTPDHQSLTQSLQAGLSTGTCNGDFVTDAGSGEINIAAGEGMIRAVNSSDSAIFAFSWSEVNGVAIPLNSVRYVGVEYNSGSPQAVVRTANNWNGQTEFQAATVVNEDGTLHIFNNPQESCDGIQKIFHRLIETQPFQFAEKFGGGRFSEVGTRNLSLSQCEFYDGLNEFAITTKNTSTGDTFDSYYGSFTKVASQTQWDNQNFDNAGTLTALSANRYGVHWLYINMDDSFSLVYGKGSYNTFSDAEAAFPPASLPLRLSLGSRLAAKLIFQQGAASVIQIESAFDTKFQSGMPVAHDDLSSILGNGSYHLSESERDAATRTATASQSGLMSAEQAQSVANSAVAGSNGQVQYNNNGVMGANSNFFWDSVNNRLGVGNSDPSERLSIDGAIAILSGDQEPVQNSSYGKIYSSGGTGGVNGGVGGVDVFTVLLVQSNTTPGSVTFIDTSTYAKSPITATGNVVHSNAQAKFGETSILFDGSGDRLNLPDSSDFSFEEDFTIDEWVYPVGAGTLGLVNYSSANKLHSLYMDSATSGRVIINGGTYLSGMVFPAGQWSHFALVRSGGTLAAYINGTLSRATPLSGTIGANTTNYIGGSTVHWGNGYIEELRVSKGVARWTANFTPPIQPYSQSSTTTDSFGLQYKHTDGTIYTLSVFKEGTDGSTVECTDYKVSIEKFYSSGSIVVGFQIFTSDATLTQSSKSSVACNPSGTGMVLTMHFSPPDGIIQTTVNASSFAVTLGRNGQKMAGAESDYTLPANTSITWQFFGATIGWLIISNG